MNCKQKLGYMALGAGIMAIGITIGQFATPNIAAQSNGVFDKIVCRELTVVDDEGKVAVDLFADEQRNGVRVFDKIENLAIGLGSSKEIGNSLVVLDKKGILSVGLFSLVEEGSNVKVFDKEGREVIRLVSYDFKNAIAVFDKAGNIKWIAP